MPRPVRQKKPLDRVNRHRRARAVHHALPLAGLVAQPREHIPHASGGLEQPRRLQKMPLRRQRQPFRNRVPQRTRLHTARMRTLHAPHRLLARGALVQHRVNLQEISDPLGHRAFRTLGTRNLRPSVSHISRQGMRGHHGARPANPHDITRPRHRGGAHLPMPSSQVQQPVPRPRRKDLPG